MELNGINSTVYTASTYQDNTTKKAEDTASNKAASTSPVVYEKSENKTEKATYTPGTKKVDQGMIDKLKADADARFSQLQDLVNKLMTKQSTTSKYASLGDLMKGVVNGEIDVDPEVVAQAKKDVADDGYWGVEQTADRIVSFAKALTGGDATKAEEMRKAIEKGFKQATKDWGSDLPEISQKTNARVNELLDEWAAERSK